MSDTVFEICYLALFMGGFSLLLCIGNGLFEIAYNFVPRFRKWVDDFIGEDFEESEVQ